MEHTIYYGAYLRNKEECFCGNTSFFSTANAEGHTMKLQCSNCSRIYTRQNRKQHFKFISK